MLFCTGGLDGHDRGVKEVTCYLRDAGYDVVFLGIRRKIDEILDTAVQKDVAIIGLSFHSGVHLTWTEQFFSQMKAKKIENIMIVCGGVIPEEDIPLLKKMGVREVFTPGTPYKVIADATAKLFADKK